MNSLPHGWCSCTVGDVTNYVTSGSRDWSQYYSKTGALFIRTQDINTNKIGAVDGIARVSLPHSVEGKRTRVYRDDLLITITGANVGKCAWISEDLPEAYVSQSVALVRLTDQSLAKFAHRQLIAPSIESGKTALEQNAYGMGRPVLNLDNVRDIELRLAPIQEQRRIIEKIDNLSAKSARARDQLDHIPRLVEKYKQAILAAAFRGALTVTFRNDHRRSISAAELEEQRKSAWQALHDSGGVSGRYNPPDTVDWRPAINIPSNWIWASVDQVSCLVQYGTSAKTTEDAQGVAVLRMGNIQDGQIDLSSLKYLPGDHAEFPDLLLEGGDVLFNRTNSAELVGKSAVYLGDPAKASFASYLIRVRCSGVLPELLAGYVNSAYGREWVASVVNQQVGQANVNGTKLRQLGIPVMPPEEQSEIVRRINTAFAWIDRLATEATNARKLIDHLDRAVLIKAFQGELVPQNPSDEPASVLLEHIRAEREASPTARSQNGKGKAYATASGRTRSKQQKP